MSQILSGVPGAVRRGPRRAGETAVLVLWEGVRVVVLAPAGAVRLPEVRGGLDVGTLPAVGRVRPVRAARPV